MHGPHVVKSCTQTEYHVTFYNNSNTKNTPCAHMRRSSNSQQQSVYSQVEQTTHSLTGQTVEQTAL